MENLEEKFIELIGKFETLATNLAPEALELGLAVARVAAAQQVVKLFVVVAIFVCMIGIAKRAYAIADWEIPNPTNLKAVGATVVAIVLGSALIKTISIWPFVGIIYPELWIAKRILGW